MKFEEIIPKNPLPNDCHSLSIGERIRGKVLPFAARAESGIPLQDNTIDRVTALYSVPLYLENPEITCSKMIKEIYRILNTDGKAYIYPIPESDVKEFTDLFNENEITTFRFTPVPEGTDSVYRNQKCYRLEFDKPATTDSRE